MLNEHLDVSSAAFKVGYEQWNSAIAHMMLPRVALVLVLKLALDGG